jgi:4-amino-4-deoxy-L-arabinose transferase-like glycosyltransferase
MDTNQLAAYAREHWQFLLLVNLGISFVFGLIPLFLSIRRGKRNFGIIALVVTALVGLPSYLLGVISAVIFTILVVRKGPAAS